MTELIILKILSGTLLLGFFSGIVKGIMNESREANGLHNYRFFRLGNIFTEGLQGIVLAVIVLMIVGCIAVLFI